MKTLLSVPVFLLAVLPLGPLVSPAVVADVLFTDVTGSAGLTDAIIGEGVCVFDMDNDGLEDFFIAGANGRNLLYRNLGGLQFEEIAAAAGVDSTGWTRLALAADIDGDGYADLFLGCHNAPAQLFRNNGDGTFENITAEAGITSDANARGGAWFDYDRDGHPDLYMGNLLTENILCRNNGDLTFTEIAGSVNARGPMPSGLVMGLATLDYDRDGDDDIFMAQDGNRGSVLLRREDDGTYTDVSVEAGVVLSGQGMGVAVGDYNQDLYPDIYITNLDESLLLRNNTDGTFTDVTAEAGVGDEPAHMGWGTFFFDADNDGHPDLYNNNQTGFGGVPNSFFRNRGDGTFEDLSEASGLRSFNDGIGSAYADFDNDGDLDIILSGQPSGAGNLKLFRNDSSNPYRWIQLTLRSGGPTAEAIGSVVELHAGGTTQWGAVAAGSGYISQNTLRLHFGLGDVSSVDSVVVFWTDGTTETFFPSGVDLQAVLVQGSGVTSVAGGEEVPTAFRLMQNYPNPFNPATVIEYRLPEGGGYYVLLKVVDLLGRDVATLVDGEENGGHHRSVWNAAGVASGVYLYRLEATPNGNGSTFRASRRMMLIR